VSKFRVAVHHVMLHPNAAQEICVFDLNGRMKSEARW